MFERAMKRFVFSALLYIPFLLANSCVSPEYSSNVPSFDKGDIVFRTATFINENTDTKVSGNIKGDSFSISWSAGDTIGIFPSQGSQISYRVNNGEGTAETHFDGEGWLLEQDSVYYSYFPFINNFYQDKKHIPVSFTEQIQQGNNDTRHLEQKLFMSARSMVNSKGYAEFKFIPKGSVIKIDIPVKPGEYSHLTMESSTEEPLFIIEGEYDMTEGDSTIEPLKCSSFVRLNLENISFENSTSLIAFLTIAPIDLIGKTITIKAFRKDGTSDTFWFQGLEFKAGHFYSLKQSLVLSKYNIITSAEGSTEIINTNITNEDIKTEISVDWVSRINTDDKSVILLKINKLEPGKTRETDIKVIVNGTESYIKVKQGYINLCLYGRANCYIINKEGGYYFNALYQGNSDQLLSKPYKAEVLWESSHSTEPVEPGVILDPTSVVLDTDSGLILFKTPQTFTNGNAVIAVRGIDDNDGDGKGDILWSWHIWAVLDYEPISEQRVIRNSITVMDRNLGAVSASMTDGPKTYGLIYQHARKDPFLGVASREIFDEWPSSEGYSNTLWRTINGENKYIAYKKETSSNPFPSGQRTSPVIGTYEFANAHPMVYITAGNDTRECWQYTSSTNSSYTASDWVGPDGKKSVNDPCPPGWKVPISNLSNYLPSSYTERATFDKYWNEEFSGFLFDEKYSIPDLWMPLQGTRYVNSGLCGTYYYNDNPDSNTVFGMSGGGMGMGSTGMTYTSYRYPIIYGSALGLPVRCVRE